MYLALQHINPLEICERSDSSVDEATVKAEGDMNISALKITPLSVYKIWKYNYLLFSE